GRRGGLAVSTHKVVGSGRAGHCFRLYGPGKGEQPARPIPFLLGGAATGWYDRGNTDRRRRQMEVRLVVEKGGRKRILYMREPQGVIGRARGNTVRVPSADVSRQHCRLRVVDGVLEVEDLDSVNGTFLNSGKVSGWQAVRPGDKLEVGPVKFVIE